MPVSRHDLEELAGFISAQLEGTEIAIGYRNGSVAVDQYGQLEPSQRPGLLSTLHIGTTRETATYLHGMHDALRLARAGNDS